jgi:hypothetical protein
MYMSEHRVKSKDYDGVSLSCDGGSVTEMAGGKLDGQGSFKCVISRRCPLPKSYSVGDRRTNDWMHIERLWNDNDRRKPTYWAKNLSQCHFVHRKSHMTWPEIEPGPPQWEICD